MLSKKVEKALNEQIAVECRSSYGYLAMASWCEVKGMDGCAQFLYAQSEEERGHMLRLFHYINASGGHALTPVPESVPTDFKDIMDVFEQFLAGEVKVSAAVNKLVSIATKEEDYTTLNFLQWYVNEQHEEETTARTILDRIRLIGTGGNGLYLIDKELESMVSAAAKKEAEANKA